MKVFRNVIAIILISLSISIPAYFPSCVQAEEAIDSESTGEPTKPEPPEEEVMPLTASSTETTDEPGSGLKVSLPDVM